MLYRLIEFASRGVDITEFDGEERSTGWLKPNLVTRWVREEGRGAKGL